MRSHLREDLGVRQGLPLSPLSLVWACGVRAAFAAAFFGLASCFSSLVARREGPKGKGRTHSISGEKEKKKGKAGLASRTQGAPRRSPPLPGGLSTVAGRGRRPGTRRRDLVQPAWGVEPPQADGILGREVDRQGAVGGVERQAEAAVVRLRLRGVEKKTTRSSRGR